MTQTSRDRVEQRRRERIEHAVRELTQAIEHGEGVDVALDHLSEATATADHRPKPSAA